MLAFGQKLCLLRVRKKITQAELSARSGVSQANLSKIENGTQDPTVSTLLKICSALEIRPAALFEEESPRSRPLLTLTRGVSERITQAVWNPRIKLSSKEKQVRDLLKTLIPEAPRRRPSDKRVYQSWLALREAFRPEEIKLLTERVREKKLR